MASISVIINSPKLIKDLTVPHRKSVVAIANLLVGLVSGALRGSVYFGQTAVDAAKASGSIAITHANLGAGDTVTVLGQAYTARASGAVANEFNIGADAAADAVNLAAALNANTGFAQTLVATASSGTVTITARAPGVIGNKLLQMATSDATAFALTQLSGGAGASGPMAYIGR